MNIDSFFAHHGIKENPFAAEEARLDPVYGRLLDADPAHPDFPKVLGQIDQPSTSIVFGEKGSGKTAIRLMMAKQIAEHNERFPELRVLSVVYDDLNPVLDNLLHSRRQNVEKMLDCFRIEDHQDAILSRAVTRLVNGLLGVSRNNAAMMPSDLNRRIRKQMSRQNRIDLAVLAAVYDQPDSGSVVTRWHRLCKKLRLRLGVGRAAMHQGAIVLSVAAAGLLITFAVMSDQPMWLAPALGISAAAAVLLWGLWSWRTLTRWWLCRKVCKETPAVDRTVSELRAMLARLSHHDLARQPFPLPETTARNERDSRYQLTRRLVDLLQPLGYVGIVVLVDRLDEPTLVAGNADHMKRIVWPMLDNKFLQQDRVGLKMLLPIELRHLLHRESAAFFQEARLDKQHMIDRLTWSGPTLYDLCTRRLRACRNTADEQMALTDLFENTVTRDLLIDSLDQMHQPRDAFKFLYAAIQEHCRIMPEGDGHFKIARLTLDAVRRDQAQRVQELYRGLTPA